MHNRRISLLVTICLSLIGCSILDRTDVDPDDGQFQGIADFLDGVGAGGSPVDVISIHGMCTHGLDWVRETGAELAEGLSLTASGPVSPATDVHGAKIWTNELKDRSGNIRVMNYAIVWSELTESQKGALCYDSDVETESCPNIMYEGKRRAKLNGQLKSELLNDCLSDVIVYADNATGTRIRKAVRGSIVEIDGRLRHNSHAPLVLITESLGSKILYDVVFAADGETDRQSVLDALAPTRQIFMAANQIELLGLAISPDDKVLRLVRETDPSMVQLRDLIRARRPAAFEAAGNSALEDDAVPIVAFTDPNDLLSYRIKDSTAADVFNVTVRNDVTILWYVENPFTAHTGYLTNPDVWAYIACGSDRTCPALP